MDQGKKTIHCSTDFAYFSHLSVVYQVRIINKKLMLRYGYNYTLTIILI